MPLTATRMQFIMDNDIFKQYSDPFDRLEELEIIASGHALALQHISEQVRDNAQNQLKITETLKALSVLLDQIIQQQCQLNSRIERLENEKPE